jgi:hypothetical protein
MSFLRKYLFTLVVSLALVLVLAGSAFATTYHYFSGYLGPGEGRGSYYAYNWYYNIYWTQSDGTDKTVTFIDASDGYHWKATVRNTNTDTITKYYAPSNYKKGYCLMNGGPVNYGVCTVVSA